MKRKRTFNKIEEQLLSIPTWRLITEVVIVLAATAILLEPNKQINPVKVVFDNAESIAIASAVVLYFKEIPERKKQKHYEAWQVIDNAKDIETSYARRKALEDLYQDGISFDSIDLSKAFLRNIDLSGANLFGANLSEAFLERANFINADLFAANLNRAQLYHAKFDRAELNGAQLNGAKLSGAQLNGAKLNGAKLIAAKLIGANLNAADLSGANLEEADLSGTKIKRANLFKANIRNIDWDDKTQWPEPSEVAKALNIPEALKRQLGITDTIKTETTNF